MYCILGLHLVIIKQSVPFFLTAKAPTVPSKYIYNPNLESISGRCEPKFNTKSEPVFSYTEFLIPADRIEAGKVASKAPEPLKEVVEAAAIAQRERDRAEWEDAQSEVSKLLDDDLDL